MLDTHSTEHGLTEVWTPVLVRDEAMLGTGQLPKFAEDSYQTTNGWWLIPTAEVTLTNIVAGQILAKTELPLPLHRAGPSASAPRPGSAGKDVRGMLRQHQFEKVEMVSIVRPEDGRGRARAHDRAAPKASSKRSPCPTAPWCSATGDMGFGARRTHDIEVWLPGQNTYREISSCSLLRRLPGPPHERPLPPRPEAKPEFVHTLNGSGLAVGRTLIAVMENYQDEDGGVTLPEALRPYLGGRSRIAPDGALA